MEAKSMALDRLPWKNEVISQLLYFFEFYQGVEGYLPPSGFAAMVASAVGYIWTQAGIPCLDHQNILSRIKGLVSRIVEAALPLCPGVAPDKLTSLHNVFRALDPDARCRISSLVGLNDLFDVLDVDDNATESKTNFYEDQKSERKLSIVFLKDRLCYKGDDVYFTRLKDIYRKHWLLQFPKMEHYHYPQDHLPTEMDVLRFVKSRLSFRKNSHSMGLGSIPTKEVVAHEAYLGVKNIWERKRLPVAITVHSAGQRRVLCLFEQLNIRTGYTLRDIHSKGLGLPHVRHLRTWENKAYEDFWFDGYQREVFSLLSEPKIWNPKTNSRRKLKRKIGKISLSEIESISMKSSRLRTEDFEEFLSGTSPVDEEEWKERPSRTEEDPSDARCDTFGFEFDKDDREIVKCQSLSPSLNPSTNLNDGTRTQSDNKFHASTQTNLSAPMQGFYRLVPVAAD